MSQMFQSVKIGEMEIKNRFVHSATHEVMADNNGRITDELTKRYKNLAKGEVGLIIPGHMYVHPLGNAHHGQMGIHNDDMIPGLKRLADTIHENGGKVAFQLAHGGRQTPKQMIGTQPLAPSKQSRDPVTLNKPQQMSEELIEETIEAFAAAAARAVEAGSDAVQIHAAHGYLICEFLSPFFNKRKDKWGGSDENRFRLIKEVIKRTKSRLPDDIPVIVKMNTNDYTPFKGITPDLAAVYAKWMTVLSVDAVEISCGTYYTFHTIRGEIPVPEMAAGLPMWMRPVAKVKLNFQKKGNIFKDAYNLDAAKKIKPNMGDTPLILVGGMRKLSQMEEIVENGDADLISMSRPFIREPFLVKRFQEGKSTEASCVNCNKCFAAMFNSIPIKCYEKGLPGF
ncbi:MAG: NADH:flavin oxidoreductase [Desulfobacteraceae bacterium]|nr:NADH:flavin oxidoreductase [Desulfobacteraceae bacterium]MBC2756564.1 NADH:flavin oxidoreductase [Desulfobacteraceae bacterium]